MHKSTALIWTADDSVSCKNQSCWDRLNYQTARSKWYSLCLATTPPAARKSFSETLVTQKLMCMSRIKQERTAHRRWTRTNSCLWEETQSFMNQIKKFSVIIYKSCLVNLLYLTSTIWLTKRHHSTWQVEFDLWILRIVFNIL